jgi:hypothetical protein
MQGNTQPSMSKGVTWLSVNMAAGNWSALDVKVLLVTAP